MLIGYARVSTDEQNTDLQVKALKAAGVRVIHQESASGAAERPALEALLLKLKPGDVLMAYKVDRLARSLYDLMRVLKAIEAAGATFRSLTEPIETTTPAGRLMVQMLGAFAEFERAIIQERCEAGRRAALERGVKFGRKYSLTEEQTRQMVDRFDCATHAARAAGVSLGTVQRAAELHGLTFRYSGRNTRWAMRSARLGRKAAEKAAT